MPRGTPNLLDKVSGLESCQSGRVCPSALNPQAYKWVDSNGTKLMNTDHTIPRYRSGHTSILRLVIRASAPYFLCLQRYSIRFAKFVLNFANAQKNAQPTYLGTNGHQ